MKWLHLSIGLLGLGAAAFAIAQPDPQRDEGDPISDLDTQAPSVLDTITTTIDNMTAPSDPTLSENEVQGNRRAFLDMIAYSEGTNSPNGYSMMFGGGLAANLNDHPRKFFKFTNSKGENLTTSAAGRYQFLAKTWDGLVRKLGLPDFSPASQDAGALELIRQCGALDDVDAGRVDSAIKKCAKIWASFPNAGYAQPERKLSSLTTAYANAGGWIDTETA